MMLRKITVWLLLLLILLPLSQALGAEARIFDEANLLTAEQEERLMEAILLFQERTGLDFVVLISTERHPGRSAEAVADDFYDYGGFGFDAARSGILYFIDMSERYQHLSTTGAAIAMLTDSRIESLIDGATAHLSSGGYADAVDYMIRKIEKYGYKSVSSGEMLISAVVGLVVAFFFVRSVKSRYQLKGSTYRYDYNANADLDMTDSDDNFLRTTTTTMRKPPPSSNSGSSGGGSSTHTSSSGRTHGGGGGRF